MVFRYSSRTIGFVFLVFLFHTCLIAGETRRQDYAPIAFESHPTDSFLYRGLPSSSDFQTGSWLKSRLISYGSWEDYQKDNNLTSFKTSSFGFFTGLERRGKRDVFLGFDIGADWISSRENNHSLDKESDIFKMLLRGGMERDQWLWDFRFGYAYHDQTITEQWPTSVFHGKNTANQYGFSTEFRIKVSSGLFQMEPFIGFDYLNLDEGRYQLTSQSWMTRDVSIGSHCSKGGLLGLRYKWRHTGLFATWYPELNAFWYHEFGDQALFRSSWGDPFPSVYTVSGYQNDQDHLVFGASVLGSYGKSMDIFLKYNTSVTGKENIHTAMVGMNWYFR